MEQKTISLKDVKTPKTVEEFRENLRKYYWCIRNPQNEYVLNVKGKPRVKIDELNSLNDLYKFDPEPCITPLVNLDGYYYKDKNYSIYKSQKDFISLPNNSIRSYWIKDQILREFYIKTLGDFSGYVTDK